MSLSENKPIAHVTQSNCYDASLQIFIAPDMWPPNSSDLNPIDYAIWFVIQQRVYETRVHDIGELRQRLLL